MRRLDDTLTEMGRRGDAELLRRREEQALGRPGVGATGDGLGIGAPSRGAAVALHHLHALVGRLAVRFGVARMGRRGAYAMIVFLAVSAFGLAVVGWRAATRPRIDGQWRTYYGLLEMTLRERDGAVRGHGSYTPAREASAAFEVEGTVVGRTFSLQLQFPGGGARLAVRPLRGHRNDGGPKGGG